MAHVHALGALSGIPGCADLADLALVGLRGRLHDDEHGGWFASTGPDESRDGTKSAYRHVFVLLAAATATVAGLSGARPLLDDHFLTPSGLYAERWDRGWTTQDPYRGINANMHAVEAHLAAFDATGEHRFLTRASAVATRVVSWASENLWCVPEHFDVSWAPLLGHHRDQPDHPFESYGATVGHGLEWSRLLVTLRASLGDEATTSLLPAARALFDRAVEDGWAVDGHPGFVYTTGWTESLSSASGCTGSSPRRSPRRSLRTRRPVSSRTTTATGSGRTTPPRTGSTR